jgi:tetratricopeptide (TPR) repeat protein
MASIYLSIGTTALAEARLQPDDLSLDPSIALERARVLAPNNPLVLRRLAEVYTLQGRYDEAVAALERAVALQPSSLLVG